MRPNRRRPNDARMRHAVDAVILDIGVPGGQLCGNVRTRVGGSDDCVSIGIAQGRCLVDGQFECRAANQRRETHRPTVAASDHHAVARLEITNGPIKGRRGETQQARAGGGGRLPDLNPADHYSSTAPGRTLIGRKRSVAFDQSDASRRKAKFLGDDLPDGGARSGSKVDLPGEHSDPAVPCDAEITVDAVGCDCVDACLGAARQGERDDDSRGAAEERAARDRGHGSALPRRAKNSGNHPRMTAAPAKILGERLPDVGFSRTRAAR